MCIVAAVVTIPFLRRRDGSVNFNRPWKDYVRGFGDKYNEFWLGLDKLHRYTSTLDTGLIVKYSFWNETWRGVKYERFYVAGWDEQYKLTVMGYGVNSTGGDALLNVSFCPITDNSN